ncbi:MAG TPA: hypothetical protein VF163_16385, partial [Micromonosporaceae bacterium]
GPTPGRDDWRPEDRRNDDRHGNDWHGDDRRNDDRHGNDWHGDDRRDDDRHGADRHTGDWRTGERRPAEARGAGRRRAPSTGAVVMGHVAARAKALGRDAQQSRNRSRMIIAVGAVLALALAGVGAMTGLFGGGDADAGPAASASAGPSVSEAPLIAVQEYQDSRGIAVNVPKGWKKSTGGSYVDFTDPDGGRKVRINVENTSVTAKKFLQQAETGLRNPSRCPSPYAQMALREVTLAGQPAAELEYTCGTGDSMRHGIWRAVVVDGKAYHFYLTVPDPAYAESNVIFAEMVRSFRFL